MTEQPQVPETDHDGDQSGLPKGDPRLQPKGPPTKGEPGLGEIQK